MAAKVEKLGANETAVALVAAVFILNWLCARYLDFPFAWCWGKRFLQPVLEPWLFVTHFMALGYMVICILKREAFKIVQGLMVVVIVFGIPTFIEILLRLGKSCTSGIVPILSLPMFGDIP